MKNKTIVFYGSGMSFEVKTYFGGLHNEQTGICYTLQGDNYLPDLALPTEEEQPIGIWGQRHRRFLKEHYRILYYNLLITCKLNSYLSGIDRQA